LGYYKNTRNNKITPHKKVELDKETQKKERIPYKNKEQTVR
jgi:hypothetical protein